MVVANASDVHDAVGMTARQAALEGVWRVVVYPVKLVAPARLHGCGSKAT